MVIEGIGALLAGTRVAELMHRRTAIRLRPTDLPAARDDGLRVTARDDGLRVTARDDGLRVTGQGSTGKRSCSRAFVSWPFRSQHWRRASPISVAPARPAPIRPGFVIWLPAWTRACLAPCCKRSAATGRSTPHPGAAQPVLHLNLTLPAILGEAFGRLVDACRARGASLGIEVAYVEICAGPVVVPPCQGGARAGGCHAPARWGRWRGASSEPPWKLGADRLKLDWSPQLAADDTETGGEITAAIERARPASVVLQRADTAVAIAWGMARGIEHFQGRQVDAMLGARRIASCHLADGCTARQCIDRAAAVSHTGRSGCGNTSLLDGFRPTPSNSAPVGLFAGQPQALHP